MKRSHERWLGAVATIAVATASAFFAGGCQNEEGKYPSDMRLEQEEETRQFDAGMVEAIRDEQVRAAIIEQHTLFPYHFVSGTSTLNELGQRDLAVLTEHVLAGSEERGAMPLSVRRGGASDSLYNARVKAVADELARGGLGEERVQIADSLPAGRGMPGERVGIVLQRDVQNKPYYEESSGGNVLDKLLNRSSGSQSGQSK